MVRQSYQPNQTSDIEEVGVVIDSANQDAEGVEMTDPVVIDSSPERRTLTELSHRYLLEGGDLKMYITHIFIVRLSEYRSLIL